MTETLLQLYIGTAVGTGALCYGCIMTNPNDPPSYVLGAFFATVYGALWPAWVAMEIAGWRPKR